MDRSGDDAVGVSAADERAVRSLSPTYQWLNVLPGAGFIVNSGWNGAYPSAALNLIWIGIGRYGLFRGARVHPGPAA